MIILDMSHSPRNYCFHLLGPDLKKMGVKL